MNGNSVRRGRNERVSAASPLDPFLLVLLRFVADRPNGLSQHGAAATVAEAMDAPVPFVEALFASARSRGLATLQPGGGRGSKVVWRISPRGRAWLDAPRPGEDASSDQEEQSASIGKDEGPS